MTARGWFVRGADGEIAGFSVEIRPGESPADLLARAQAEARAALEELRAQEDPGRAARRATWEAARAQGEAAGSGVGHRDNPEDLARAEPLGVRRPLL